MSASRQSNIQQHHPPILRITSLSSLSILVLGTIRLDEIVRAVILNPIRALLAIRLQAALGLRTDTNSIALLDALLNILANSDSFPDDLVAHNCRIWSLSWRNISTRLISDSDGRGPLTPSTAKRVKIATTDLYQVNTNVRDRVRPRRGWAYTTVRNLNIDILFIPRLGLISLPLHIAIRTIGVQANPSFKFLSHIDRTSFS